MHKLGVEFLVMWDILHYMQKYIDAHCHYVPRGDITPVVGFMYNSARPSDWRHAIAALGVRGGAGAIGIHPWYVDEIMPDWAAQMICLLRDNPNLMIGEIGLDRSRGNLDRQMPVFLRQLEMARELGRVAHIHCVRAWDVMLNVFATHKMPPILVIHGGVPSADVVRAVMQHANAYFSYGAVRSDKIAATILATPIDRILVESDAASPAVARTLLPRTVGEIAELSGHSATEMAETIYNNTQRMIKNGGQITQN